MERTWQSISWLILLVGISLLIFPAYLSAHGPTAPPHQSYQMGDLNLESGETINPFTVAGHLSASGANPVDVEFLNREIGEFLDTIHRR